MSKLVLNADLSASPSQLLTVRLWREDLGDGRSEWRGQVQHALSRETRYFHGWQMLIACVQDILEHCAERPATSPDNACV